jgi:hypothetical protein
LGCVIESWVGYNKHDTIIVLFVFLNILLEVYINMGTNLECAFNSQTINEFHSIVVSSKFITFIKTYSQIERKANDNKKRHIL